MITGNDQVIPLTAVLWGVPAAFLITRTLIPTFIRILMEADFVRPNFRGELIPLGMGIVFYISLAIVIGLGKLIGLFNQEVYMFLFSAALITIFGLMDDIFGSRNATGLTGHFKVMIIKGQVTTGAIKALAGVFSAVIVSVELMAVNGEANIIPMVLNILVISMSINLVNLLDLRPGRAGKGFLIMSLFLLIAGVKHPGIGYLALTLASVAVFMPYDLNARVMMGDAGSNTLGFVLGYTAVFLTEESYKTFYLIFLLALHLLTEKYSLTQIIEKNRFLNFIDMIGRR